MKKHYASILLTLASLIGLGVSAVGQEKPEIVVNVPFDFVAGDRTLPAGKYTVSRVSDSRLGALSFSSYETRTGVFVMTNEFKDQAIEDCKVTFEQVGDVHFLRSIEAPDGIYTVALPRAMMNVVAMKQHDNSSSSGAN